MNPIIIFFIVLAVGAVISALITIVSNIKAEKKDYRPLAGSAFILFLLALMYYGSL